MSDEELRRLAEEWCGRTVNVDDFHKLLRRVSDEATRQERERIEGEVIQVMKRGDQRCECCSGCWPHALDAIRRFIKEGGR